MVAVARPRAGSSSDRLGGTFGQIAFPVQQNTGEPRRTVRRRVPGTAGPNIDQPVSVSPVAGEVAGTYLAEYTTLPPSVIETTTGADTLQAFVDHTPGTAALDPREPSDTATITVVGRPVSPITLNVIGPNPVTAFTNSTRCPLNASPYVFNVTAVGPNAVGNLRVADACDGNS